MHSPTNHAADTDGDINIVALWLQADRVRWMAGVIAGLFAGLVALAFAGVLSAMNGMEFLFPVKLMGSTVVGASATEVGFHMGALIAGLAVFEAISAFWGFVYAHFVKTNCLASLLAMGLVWGTFSWIFEWNLFFHSFKTILAADISAAPVFFVCLVYGVSLSAVAFFDRALR